MTMLLIAVFACWLGWIVRSAHEQKQAAEAILARGGCIEYDYKYDSSRSRRLPKGESSATALATEASRR